MKKVILLDRDGVINYDSPYYIKSPEEFHFIPGSIEVISKLTKAGYEIGVATNQSGLSRGYYDLDTLEKIHQKMCTEIEKQGGKIKFIEFCPHMPDAGCACRKPQPGMLINLAQKFEVDIGQVYFVGDKMTDVQAAIAAGAKPVFISSQGLYDLENISCKNLKLSSTLKDFVNTIV
jgi:D-glycero-D-manno-heptose 1,7-bisphosphate phosphatase